MPLFAFLRTVRGLRALPIGFFVNAAALGDRRCPEGLKLDFPKVDGQALNEFRAVERALKAERPE